MSQKGWKRKMKKNIIRIVAIFVVITLFALPVYALEPSSSIIYEGIDVSAWQENIDYAKVKQDGIEIVYMKTSQGSSYIDPYFKTNYANAKANGLKVGFYHFLTATTEEQARRQAEFFASVIAKTSPDCRLAMDFEQFNGLGRDAINRVAEAFMARLYELTDKELVIYSNANDAKNVFSQSLANKYPLWVAQYGPSKPMNNGKWSSWVGFQYTDRGRINGIRGNVDRNKFTEQILLGNSTEIPEHPDNPIPPTDEIIYTVKRGDTLSEIAQKYGTTVNELVKLNNIPNKNLIYVGQTIRISGTASGQTGTIIVYTVKRGDTLSEIAQKYGTTVNELVRLNNIANRNLIYVGQIIKINTSESESEICDCSHTIYTVKYGDTLTYIAKKYQVTINEIVELNDIKNPNLIYVGEKLRI